MCWDNKGQNVNNILNIEIIIQIIIYYKENPLEKIFLLWFSNKSDKSWKKWYQYLEHEYKIQ